MNGKIQDAKTLVYESEIRDQNKTSHQNKCNINETVRLNVKAVEISRLDKKFVSAKILEVPSATPNLCRSLFLIWVILCNLCPVLQANAICMSLSVFFFCFV